MNRQYCDFPPPNRARVELPNGMWGTREWRPGEKADYQRFVLTRPVRTGEGPVLGQKFR